MAVVLKGTRKSSNDTKERWTEKTLLIPSLKEALESLTSQVSLTDVGDGEVALNLVAMGIQAAMETEQRADHAGCEGTNRVCACTHTHNIHGQDTV